MRTPRKTVWWEGVSYSPGDEVPDDVAEQFGSHVWRDGPESGPSQSSTSPAPEEEEEEVESEYEAMTIPELQKECAKRSIQVHSSWKKAQLVEALEKDDL